MAEPHKVRIKIGDAEFEAEGSEESVKSQFDAFLAALAMAPKAAPAATTNPNTTTTTVTPDPAASAGGGDLDQALIERAFVQGKDGISLKYLPKGDNRDADAALLLLLGFWKLKGEEAVLGTHLIKAARVSGITLDRIDRALMKHKSLFLTGGARKGVRYTLNNQGKLKAQEMLKALLMT